LHQPERAGSAAKLCCTVWGENASDGDDNHGGDDESESNTIEALASIVFPNLDWGQCYFMPLICTFDASGQKPEHPFIVVAGFLSSVSDWAKFESRWMERLSQDNIDCFHANKIYSYFAGESDVIRKAKLDSLTSDLMSLIQEHAYSRFGCVVGFEDLNRMPEEMRQRYRLVGYSYAARTCVEQARKWLKGQMWKNPAVEYVFEDGDEGVGHLIDNFKQAGYGIPIFRPKKDRLRPDGTIQKAFVPLQAADWLAHTYFDSYRGYLQSSPRKIKRTWTFKQFERISGDSTAVTDKSIDNFIDLIRLADETQHLDDLKKEADE
jgi:hypothetical protein